MTTEIGPTCRGFADAYRHDVLTGDVWAEKRQVITDLYGFGCDTWEAGPLRETKGSGAFTRRGRRSRHPGVNNRESAGLDRIPPIGCRLATQGQLLCSGLREIGVDVHPVHFESPQEKEWYYRWFQPDVVVGIAFSGHIRHLVLHPQQFGMKCVPWLVADGYVAAHRELLNALPLILVTSNWVKATYIRDGIRGDNIEALPVGCDTDAFVPHNPCDPKVRSIREALGVADGQVMILTVGGDAASKGAQEVMEACRNQCGAHAEARQQKIADADEDGLVEDHALAGWRASARRSPAAFRLQRLAARARA